MVVGLNLDDAARDLTVFTRNRNRLLRADIAKQFCVRTSTLR